jgi:hypothetical protein
MVDAVLWILQSKMDQGVHGSFKQPLQAIDEGLHDDDDDYKDMLLV